MTRRGDGVPATSPERMIVDSLDARTQREQIELVARQALERGLTTPRRLLGGATTRPRRVAALVRPPSRRNRSVRSGDAAPFRQGLEQPPEPLGGSQRFTVGHRPASAFLDPVLGADTGLAELRDVDAPGWRRG